MIVPRSDSTPSRRAVRVALVLGLVMLAASCATGTFERPRDHDIGALRARAETAIEEGVRVSVAIPSLEEIDAIFGVDLSSRNIQPVWVEIENDTDRRLHFMITGMDPEYFAPREVAFLFHGSLSDQGRKSLDRHLERLKFENPIDPRSTASGFVYANEDRGTKFVSVDLLSAGWSNHLTLLAPIPDRALSDDQVGRIHATVAQSSATDVDRESELRTRLEKLPCCAASEHGVRAEPLNVVIIGHLDATGPGLVRGGFHYSPLPPLYVFGRPQDISGRKGSRWVAAQPHLLRLWVTDFRFRGRPVWVGQISTPRGGRFADGGDDSKALIDPDVDRARDDLVQDAIYSQLLGELGFVKGVGAVSASAPRTTPGGSTYHTDGLRAVLMFETDPRSMTEIEFMSWEIFAEHYRE